MNWHQILNVILSNLRFILKITLVSAIFLFVIFLFIYPKTYNSTVSILPPEQENNFGSFSSLIGSGDFSSLLTGGMSSASSQLFVEILKSRSAALDVVKELNLKDFLGADNSLEAAEKLQDRLNTDISKEGIVTLSVDVRSSIIPLLFSDSDSLKILSSKISKSYIETLDKINRAKLSSKAKSARIFIENQIIETKALLDSAETNLMDFQSKNKAISLPDQVKAAIEGATQLKSEIVQTEIQLNIIKLNAGGSNKLYTSLNKKLQALKDQYEKFDTSSEDYLLAFKNLPRLGKSLAGLLREVRIQNEVYLLLQQQYYKEKIQENKDIPTITILDNPIPPLKHSKPKVISSTIAGSVFIFLILSIFVVLRENKKIIQKT